MTLLSFLYMQRYYTTCLEVLSIFYHRFWSFRNKWLQLRQLWAPFSKKRCSLYASSACFYIALSFIPASILTMTVLSRLKMGLPPLTDWFSRLVPTEFSPIFSHIMVTLETSPKPQYILSSISLLWSASKGVSAIASGLSEMLDLSVRPPYLRIRIKSMILFLFILALLIVSLILSFIGNLIWDYTLSDLGRFQFYLAIFLQYTCSLFLLSISFSAVFYIFPVIRLPFAPCFFGGSITALGWAANSYLFSLYVRFTLSSSPGRTGIDLALLAWLWLYISVTVLFCGALLSRMLQDGTYHPIQILKNSMKK